MSADLVLARRDRVFGAMVGAGIDVLVLGRQDNTGYACGMRRLWTAGTRPFGAGCIIVGSTGRVHALSSWEAGIEPPMTFDDLYPLTWNPRVMAASMAGIEGLGEASRIGVDELTPSFRRAVAGFAPAAEVVAADDLMARVRRHKLPGEIDAISRACAAAWVGVDAALSAPAGADPAVAAVEALAATGSTIPSSGVRADRRESGLFIDIGVICDLYEGGVGGFFVDGRREPRVSSLLTACCAGATRDNLAAAAATDARLRFRPRDDDGGGDSRAAPTAGDWLVRGLGMGFERPVIGPRIGAGKRLEAGMVLSVATDGGRDVVHVTDDGPVVLSTRR